MLTEVELYHKRNYKNSIRHSKRRGWTGGNSHRPQITIKPLMTYEPLPKKTTTFERLKAKAMGLFTRRKTG